MLIAAWYRFACLALCVKVQGADSTRLLGNNYLALSLPFFL